MAVQTTWIRNTDGSSPYTFSTSPNSAKLIYPAAATLIDVQDTMEYIITGGGYNSGTPSLSTGPKGGWAVWDAAAGTSHRCYRALNLDGITYKYAGFDFGTNAGYLHLRVFESWNAVSHLPTNEVQTTLDQAITAAQRVDLAAGASLFIAVNVHWLAIQSQVIAGIGSTTGSAFLACLEITRDNSEDTPGAGYPCWCWLNSSTVYNQTTGNSCFLVPRTLGNNTGISAYGYPVVDWGAPTTSSAQYLSTMNPGTNPWNSKYYVSGIRAIIASNGNLNNKDRHGTMFGIKLLSGGAGALADQCVVNCDANFFVNSTGAAFTHFIMIESVQTGRYAFPM